MSDVNRMDAVLEEDRLPWLEAVGEEEAPRGAGPGALVAALIAALVALGLVVGGVFWLRDRHQGDGAGEGELIAAPAGDYKVKPSAPGGMKVEGQGDAAYAASTGATLNSAIDISALPETPVRGAGSVATADATAAPAKPAAAPARPATAVAAAARPVSGGVIQLGAFSSSAKANEAWRSLSGRFAYLKPYSGGVTPVTIGRNTLYRLRASTGAEAPTICGKLKVAGETCAVVAN